MLVNNWKSVRKNGDHEKISTSVCRCCQSAWEKGCWMWMDCMQDRYEMKRTQKNVTQIFNLYYCRWIFIYLRKRLLDVNGLYEGQTQDIKKNMTKIFNLYYSRWFFICKHSSHHDIKTHEHNVHFLWINVYSANEMYTKSTQGSFTLPNDTMIRQFGDCSNWSL